MMLNRRRLLAGTAALAASVPGLARGQDAATGAFVNAADFGLTPIEAGVGTGQTNLLQEAVNAAARARLPLFIPGGSYAVDMIELPSGLSMFGVRGVTALRSATGQPLLAAQAQRNIAIRDLLLDGLGVAGDDVLPGLVTFVACEGIALAGLEIVGGQRDGLHLEACAGHVEALRIGAMGDNGVFAIDSRGLTISGCRIEDCGNGGIRVWANDAAGHDGTLVTGNHIGAIRSDGGGNGQNGNGINVYRANGVVVSNNRIRGCEFSAIRLNTTSDTIVSGNTCLDSGEVAIFSEFGFSGSVISGNIVDGAGLGISMTNFNESGRLATCTGNIVRNIAPSSRSNPDTRPAGIYAEADAVVADNLVDAVPGIGIGVGWGPYLRDVSVTGNVVRDVEIGIGVSVAPEAGPALVANNLVSGARRAAIAGLAWTDMVSDDLARDASRFPHVTLSGNRAG